MGMQMVVIKDQIQIKIEEVEELSLAYMQSVVGGYIETVYVEPGLMIIVNEEGAIRNLPVTVVNGQVYFGTVLFVKPAGEEIVGLDKNQIIKLLEVL